MGNHSMFDYTILRKSLNALMPEGAAKKPNKEDEDDNKHGPEGFQQPTNVVNVIFGGDPSFSKRA